MKKILIITPKFPYPARGACEQDRAAGIEFFIKSGWEVRVITKIYGEEYKKDVSEANEKLGITIIPINYKYLTLSIGQKIKNIFLRLVMPWYWDGAAREYGDLNIKMALSEELKNFKPNLVWFDYTYLWPLYKQIKKQGIPIVTRSINFEPRHCLEEDSAFGLKYLKFFPKLLSEYLVSRWSDVIFAITPIEAILYRKLGAKQVVVMPLRGLKKYLEVPPILIRERSPLNVFFAGSTYNVAHNREALKFLLNQMIPEVERKMPGQFKFHIFGGKIPQSFSKYFNDNIIRYNYLSEEKFDENMNKMDIAIAPSLCGAGMQQKIFEPLTRGFPTIISARGLAGFPFNDNEHVLLANSAMDFVNSLDSLRDRKLREKLSCAARALSKKLFFTCNIEEVLPQN